MAVKGSAWGLPRNHRKKWKEGGERERGERDREIEIEREIYLYIYMYIYRQR